MIYQLFSIAKSNKRRRLLAVGTAPEGTTAEEFIEEHKKILHPSVLKNNTFEAEKVG